MIFELIVTLALKDGSNAKSLSQLFATERECVSAGVHADINTQRSENVEFSFKCVKRPDNYVIKSAPSKAPARQANNARRDTLSLSCSGYSRLAHASVSYLFHIDTAGSTFTGTKDGMGSLSGPAAIKESSIILGFNNGSKLEYTAWLNRETGSFKVDISTDKLYLADDTAGTCKPYAGRAF